MRYANFIDPQSGQACASVISGDRVHRIDPRRELSDLIRSGQSIEDLARVAIASTASCEIGAAGEWASVLKEPGKIICLGLNYHDHAKEGGRQTPDYPWVFLRAASSLIGHGAPAVIPRVSDQFDFEAELAVVIGQQGRHVPRESALQLVLGYTCFNDLSVRDYQKKTPQWTMGKNFDASGAFGPWLVPASALPAGAQGLRIQCLINGEVMQDANTKDMIFPVDDVIERLSACMTLYPGDVIVMGTPAGVGFARQPPLWLRPGDSVEVAIEGIGSLVTPVVAEAAT